MGVWPGLLPAHPQSSLLTGAKSKSADMDAIRKKMQSLKSETDGLYNTIAGFEEATREAAARADQADCDIRDYGKKVQQLEIGFDETNDKLTELKRAVERAELAEKNLKDIEEELETVGENMKQLETSAEKALEREEKLVEKIYNLQSKYKVTEARFEYGEMNITKLNQRIDDIEDEIYREKLKINKCSDELDDAFDDMISNY